jgi:hypothetical protein
MCQYEVRNEEGHHVDDAIIRRYYGNFWESVMDRLHHDHDGYLFTIHYQDDEFRVYRILRI